MLCCAVLRCAATVIPMLHLAVPAVIGIMRSRAVPPHAVLLCYHYTISRVSLRTSISKVTLLHSPVLRLPSSTATCGVPMLCAAAVLLAVLTELRRS